MSNQQSNQNVNQKSDAAVENQNVNQKSDAAVENLIASDGITSAQLTAWISTMAAKEARIAEKEALLEQSLKARDQQRRRDSENYTVAKIEAQKACRHLKGGNTRSRAQQKDPSVYHHTFTDRTQHVKCQLCGARWLPGDTDEYLSRNGSKIPNWTGIGWRRALEMAADSSNKPSSSERFSETVAGTAPKSDKGLDVPNLQL